MWNSSKQLWYFEKVTSKSMHEIQLAIITEKKIIKRLTDLCWCLDDDHCMEAA